MGMDWRTGQRTYDASNGYKMVENIILTPGSSFEKTRSGRSAIPREGAFSYRVSYDKDGNKRSVYIKQK
jgi:hypothetical protein